MKKREQKQSDGESAGKPQPGRSAPSLTDLEAAMSNLGLILQRRRPESAEEMLAFLQELSESPELRAELAAEALLEQAQQVMDDAWEASGKRRIELAQKALKLSNDCADAYVLLGNESAENPAEARDYYAQGMQAGERVIGQEQFAAWTGEFWGVLETRPYMRARAGLAYTLWHLGERAEAIVHLQEMLRLNPHDNQGVRYLLVNYLLAEQRHQEVEALLNRYEDDVAAEWAYSAALLAFRREGGRRSANLLLQEALEANAYVADYLLGIRQLPPWRPDLIARGGEYEAINYAADAIGVWQETDGALAWLEAADRPATLTDPAPDFIPWQPSPSPADFEELLADEDFDDWAEMEMPRPFRLDRFLAEQEIPAEEHAHFQRCLGLGIGLYYHDIYGYYKFGEEPGFLIDERMHEPYLFGYGAAQVLAQKRISTDSKLKVCRYLLGIVEMELEYGVPYGMLNALGFMARQRQLTRPEFLKGVMALEFGNSGTFSRPDWTEGATTPALRNLADWLVDCPDFSPEEKTWWAWMTSIKCERRPHLGMAFANRWLSRPKVSDAAKLEVCWAWLKEDRELDTPPLIWQVMTANSLGDFKEVNRLLRQAGIDVDEELIAQIEREDEREDEREEDVAPDSNAFTWQTIGRFMLIPHYLKRLAVPGLVRSGESLTEIIDRLWGAGGTYDTEAIDNGIADAIKEFHQQLAPDELRRLIEQGIDHSSAKVRKTFYNLSTQFYGTELLERALDDAAKSVRNWAQKKLNTLS